MIQGEFKRRIKDAKTLAKLSEYPDTEYWLGYQDGLSRLFEYGSEVTNAEHEASMLVSNDMDGTSKMRVFGYQTGFEGKGIGEAITFLHVVMAPSMLGKGKKKNLSQISLDARKRNAQKAGRPRKS